MECFNSESKKANDYTTKSAIISLFKLFVFISFFFFLLSSRLPNLELHFQGTLAKLM